MKARFHIPDFYMHWDINLKLIDMIKEKPEYFYDNIEIASCYGCFGPALWNGGRAVGGFSSTSQIKNTIKEFNDRNVPIRYTFTNPTITEKDLRDSFCNRICKLAENGFNEVIANVPCLEAYIREKYPKFPIVSSTVKQIEDHDKLIEELEKDYKLVVLDYNWNNDFEKLATIPEKHRERCEILINAYCMPHCPRRGEHYKVLGECQRKCSETAVSPTLSRSGHNNPLESAFEFNCPNTVLNFYQIQNYKTFVSRDDLYTKYLDMGYCNFKIEGRTLHKANVIESYVYYMVKPEYRDMVRLELLTVRPKRPIADPPKRHFIDTDGKPIPQADEA